MFNLINPVYSYVLCFHRVFSKNKISFNQNTYIQQYIRFFFCFGLDHFSWFFLHSISQQTISSYLMHGLWNLEVYETAKYREKVRERKIAQHMGLTAHENYVKSYFYYIYLCWALLKCWNVSTAIPFSKFNFASNAFRHILRRWKWKLKRKSRCWFDNFRNLNWRNKIYGHKWKFNSITIYAGCVLEVWNCLNS